MVEAVGSEVAAFRPGDHSVSTFFPTWLNGGATLADFATTPGDGIDGFARVMVASTTSFMHAELADALRLQKTGGLFGKIVVEH